MDGRGRLVQSLTWIAPWRARPSGRGRAASHAYAGRRIRALRRFSTRIFSLRVPSGVGWAASGLFLLATLAYGIVLGERTAAIVGALREARDATANTAGFPTPSLALCRGRPRRPGGNFSARGRAGTHRPSLLLLD